MKFMKNSRLKKIKIITFVNMVRIYIIFLILIGLYFPNYSSFNNKFSSMYYLEKKVHNIFLFILIFFLLQLLPLGSIGGYFLPYHSKENILAKQMIFQNFLGDNDLLSYLPNNLKISSTPREFSLNILANVKRVKYAKLFSTYKDIKSQMSTVGKKLCKAQIINQFKNGLNNFIPINL